MLPLDRHIMMDPGNLIPKAWKLVGRQKQPRLPSPFLRRRKSIDFAESVRFFIYGGGFQVSISLHSTGRGGYTPDVKSGFNSFSEC